MRFSIASVVAFASIATAQLAITQSALDNILKLTADLDTAINGWTGGDPSPIVQGSAKLVEATTGAAQQVSAGSPLTLQEAIKIQPVVETVQKSVEKAINDLISKKQAASDAKLGGETYKQLVAQLQGATALSQAISAKVPPTLAQVATTLSKGILNAVQKGIDAFNDIKDQVYPQPIAGAIGSGTGAAAGAAAGGAAAGGAAAGGAATGGSRASNSTTPVSTPSVAPATPAGGAAAAGNSTAAGHSGASTFQPSMILGAVVLGAAVLAL